MSRRQQQQMAAQLDTPGTELAKIDMYYIRFKM